jgi:hypothetical protein
LIKLDDVSHFASLNFNLSGQSLPPADPAAIASAFPALSWGILLFDMWVLNGDRHNGNISHDTIANKVQLFDHSHALFARGDFQPFVNAPAIGGHCLAPMIASLDGLTDWNSHIGSVPERFVRTIVGDVVGDEFGISAARAQECSDFLIARRSHLIDVAKTNAALFPKVLAAAWNGV